MTASNPAVASATAPDESSMVLYHEKWLPPFLPVLVLAPFLLPMFWNFSVSVTSSHLVFGYSWGVTQASLSRETIVDAQVVKEIHGLYQWGGWGIRKNLSWETGYIAKNGPGVKVTTADAGVYVFNCNDPDKVCEILLKSENNQ
jgi:hypothetical protein